MAVSGEEKIVQEGGTSKKKYLVTFDNGTLDQIEELKTFFKQGDKLEELGALRRVAAMSRFLAALAD